MKTMLSTPTVILNTLALHRNIVNMQKRANFFGVKLRPHVKTHRSVELAKMQLLQGACGVTCSKPEEAQVFLEAGMDVLIAYPVISIDKAEKILSYTQKHSNSKLTMMVDSAKGVDAIVAAAKSLGIEKQHVSIKIDVGLHRCGVSIGDDLLNLANQVHTHEILSQVGIFSHAGHAYGVNTADECKKIANEESQLMRSAKQLLENNGFECPLISVGCTMTELTRTDYEGIDEIRPGNYIFLDATPVRKGLVKEEDVSLFVVSTVISINDQYAIIDAGSKVLSSDTGAHGSSANSFGTTKFGPIERLSEEHGWIRLQTNDVPIPEVGDQVQIIPNHSCPVANLTNQLLLMPENRAIKVDARGYGNTTILSLD